MIKARPAVVISPRLPHRDGLCTVVPISTSAPEYDVEYVVRLEIDPALPRPYEAKEVWVKCDMLATVSFKRLDMFRTERDQYGKRKYLQPKVSEADFVRILKGVQRALGMG
jgi:uncharacterized protein YifN (PemK superfamily)